MEQEEGVWIPHLFDSTYQPYRIMRDGRLLDSEGTELPPYSSRVVRLRRRRGLPPRNMVLHKLVALAYVPNPHNYKYIHFLDGDHTNCSADNLSWVKFAKQGNGRYNAKGYVPNTEKLDRVKKVDLIRSLTSSGYTTRQVCDMLDLTPQYVNREKRKWRASKEE